MIRVLTMVFNQGSTDKKSVLSGDEHNLKSRTESFAEIAESVTNISYLSSTYSKYF